jgi:nucleoside-diphosphate-sugar epimerase
MQILVIGGTRFFGKRFVELALSRGAELSVLCRNPKPTQSHPVTWIQGDREKLGDIDFGQARFDCIVDQVCFDAAQARESMKVFANRTQRYVFTSTQSVYTKAGAVTEADFDPRAYHFARDVKLSENYGEGKRQAETVFAKQAPWPVVMARFPYVLGLDDYTERLKVQVHAIAQGKPLRFSNPDAKISVIHAQDAAESLWQLCQARWTGPINLGSPEPLALRQLVELMEAKTGRQWQPGGAQDPASRYDTDEDHFMKHDLQIERGLTVRSWRTWLPELIQAEAQNLNRSS